MSMNARKSWITVTRMLNVGIVSVTTAVPVTEATTETDMSVMVIFSTVIV